MEVEDKSSANPNSNTNPNPNSKDSSICEECGLNPSKYKCPGCSIRSCSLPCVKSHKQRTSCTGKRPRTEFVPLSQFDDNLIISVDYNLLEEAKRVAESAQRMREGLFGHSYFKLPYKLKSLRNAASRRKTHLLLLPNGMLKREKNKSIYHQRKKSIFWTIEWRFHSTDVVLTDNGVDENTNLCSVIEKHLKLGPWNHKLRPFCEEQLDCLKFFIRKNAKGPKSPYRELDIKAPISQQLANIVIVEYPVIHVLLPSASYDFEVVKDANPLPHKPTETNFPSPKGVAFKEEEIEEEEEDGISMDPQILDLMKFVNSEPLDNFRIPNSSKPMLKGEVQTEDNNAFYISNSKEFELSENAGFDFEQDLRDAYSGLIGQVNPDDFLDLDGGFLQEGDMDEELEEGEIAEF
ncbi:zinc finger protein [Macleaya cordata]|uniref:Box C/D snoRNA protein 1 n=1 Tax=Macleaya cordata TaxID=56857 RepID=A0A200PXE9_MACCD|nr:zinc finger protein [Macleaya cordata]